MSTERQEWPVVRMDRNYPGPPRAVHHSEVKIDREYETYVPQSRLAEVEAERKDWESFAQREATKADRILSLLESDEVVEAACDEYELAEAESGYHNLAMTRALQAAKQAIQKKLEEDGDG